MLTRTLPFAKKLPIVLRGSRYIPRQSPCLSDASRWLTSACPRLQSPTSDIRPARQIESELDTDGGTAKADLHYNRSADQLINSIYEIAERLRMTSVPEIENVDMQDGRVVLIEMTRGLTGNKNLTPTIVINKHYVNKQLWYSSPVSGGDYFPYKNGWVSLRSNQHILEKLQSDFDSMLGRTVPFNL